jgi:hypothetical protein
VSGPVWLDAARSGLLAGCSACPSWRELRGDRADALEAAAEHLVSVHGELAKAADLRQRAARIRRQVAG